MKKECIHRETNEKHLRVSWHNRKHFHCLILRQQDKEPRFATDLLESGYLRAVFG